MTQAFGQRIWEHTLFILTHADTVEDESDSDSESESSNEQSKSPLDKAIKSYCNAFQNILRHAGVSSVKKVQSGLSQKDDEQPDPDTIVAIPVGRKINKPKEWKTLMFKEVLKKCDAGSIPAMLEMQGIKWKKVAYYLTNGFFWGFSSVTLGAASWLCESVGIPVLKNFFTGVLDYAVLIQARLKVTRDQECDTNN